MLPNQTHFTPNNQYSIVDFINNIYTNIYIYIYISRPLSQLYTAPQGRYAAVPLAAGDAPSSPGILIGKHLSTNGFSNVYSASQLAGSSDRARNCMHTRRLAWNKVPASSIPPGPNFPFTLRSSAIVTLEVTLSPVLEAPAVCEQTPAWSMWSC